VLFVKEKPCWVRLVKKEGRNFPTDDYFDLLLLFTFELHLCLFDHFFLGTWPVTEKIPLQQFRKASHF